MEIRLPPSDSTRRGRASVEWGVTGVPETYIINAEGLVTFKHAGPITAKVLKDTILPKLREASE